MLRRRFCVLALCACSSAAISLLTGCQQRESAPEPTETLTIGYDEYRPFAFVDDNGNMAGIDVEIAQEAPGARTVYEGSGTGLSIVKKLVEAMGGTISWTSAKGQGTTFRVTLLFAIDTACRIDRSDVGNVPDPLRGANVLLVEDNEMNMEIAECLLVDLGARVTRAWDGQEAVDIFAASSTGTFDIVFMDIMMPRKNGLEATRAIRALDRPDAKTVPICAMSANAFHDDVQASLDAGTNAHFAKPIDVADVLPAIAKLVGFHG